MNFHRSFKVAILVLVIVHGHEVGQAAQDLESTLVAYERMAAVDDIDGLERLRRGLQSPPNPTPNEDKAAYYRLNLLVGVSLRTADADAPLAALQRWCDFSEQSERKFDWRIFDNVKWGLTREDEVRFIRTRSQQRRLQLSEVNARMLEMTAADSLRARRFKECDDFLRYADKLISDAVLARGAEHPPNAIADLGDLKVLIQVIKYERVSMLEKEQAHVQLLKFLNETDESDFPAQRIEQVLMLRCLIAHVLFKNTKDDNYRLERDRHLAVYLERFPNGKLRADLLKIIAPQKPRPNPGNRTPATP